MDLKTYLSQERGRQAALAKAIGAHAADMSRWADGTRPIPVPFGAPIEIETNGAVTRREMFPDTWQRIWPELAALPESDSTTPDCHAPDTSIPGTPIDGAKIREAKNGTRKVPTDVKGVMS